MLLVCASTIVVRQQKRQHLYCWYTVWLEVHLAAFRWYISCNTVWRWACLFFAYRSCTCGAVSAWLWTLYYSLALANRSCIRSSVSAWRLLTYSTLHLRSTSGSAPLLNVAIEPMANPSSASMYCTHPACVHMYIQSVHTETWLAQLL